MNKILIFVSDFLVIIILSILTIVIKYGGLEPYFRGFYCYDSSIHYPYKSSTISSELALSLSIVIPVLYINIMEVVIYLKQNTSLSTVASQLYNSTKIFSIGAITTGLLTSVGKLTIGRLRPHFLSVCKVDLDLTPEVCGTLQDPVYVTKFTCLNDDMSRVHDARLSFPSGHSSAAFYSCVFTALYLKVKTRSHSSMVLLNQIFLLSYAWYCALTRVSDYKHHPTDVLAGSILGSVVAVFFINLLQKNSNGKATKHQQLLMANQADYQL